MLPAILTAYESTPINKGLGAIISGTTKCAPGKQPAGPAMSQT